MKMTTAYSKSMEDAEDKIKALRKQVAELKQAKLDADKNMQEASRQIEAIKKKLEQKEIEKEVGFVRHEISSNSSSDNH